MVRTLKSIFGVVASALIAGTLMGPAAVAQFAPKIEKQDVENARRQEEKSRVKLPLVLSLAQTHQGCFTAPVLDDAYDKAEWKLVATAFDAEKHKLSLRADADGHWNLVAPDKKNPAQYCVAEQGSHMVVPGRNSALLAAPQLDMKQLKDVQPARAMSAIAAEIGRDGLAEAFTGTLDDGRQMHLLVDRNATWALVKTAPDSSDKAYIEQTGANFSATLKPGQP